MNLRLPLGQRIEVFCNPIKKYKYISIFCFIFVSTIFQSCGIPLMKKTPDTGFSEETRIINPFEFGDEFFIKGENALKNSVKQSSLTDKRDSAKTLRKKSVTGNIEQDLLENITDSTESDSLKSFMGFRIQIGVFDDKKNAADSAENASARFSLPVYVEYKAPFFRVMLGDFKTTEEAEKYIGYIKKEGFGDARWVPSNVNSK